MDRTGGQAHVHVAIFRWKDHVTEDQVVQALGRIKSLEEALDGVRIFSGANTTRWAQGYTHAVVVVAQAAGGIDAYRNHPLHLQVADVIEAMEADGIGVDFEDRF